MCQHEAMREEELVRSESVVQSMDEQEVLQRNLSAPSKDTITVLEDLAKGFHAVVEEVNEVERDYRSGSRVPGDCRAALAQIEAKANKLQEKGVDSVQITELNSGKEVARAMRRGLNNGLEALFERMQFLFKEFKEVVEDRQVAEAAVVKKKDKNEDLDTQKEPLFGQQEEATRMREVEEHNRPRTERRECEQATAERQEYEQAAEREHHEYHRAAATERQREKSERVMYKRQEYERALAEQREREEYEQAMAEHRQRENYERAMYERAQQAEHDRRQQQEYDQARRRYLREQERRRRSDPSGLFGPWGGLDPYRGSGGFMNYGLGRGGRGSRGVW